MESPPKGSSLRERIEGSGASPECAHGASNLYALHMPLRTRGLGGARACVSRASTAGYGSRPVADGGCCAWLSRGILQRHADMERHAYARVSPKLHAGRRERGPASVWRPRRMSIKGGRCPWTSPGPLACRLAATCKGPVQRPRAVRERMGSDRDVVDSYVSGIRCRCYSLQPFQYRDFGLTCGVACVTFLARSEDAAGGGLRCARCLALGGGD